MLVERRPVVSPSRSCLCVLHRALGVAVILTTSSPVRADDGLAHRETREAVARPVPSERHALTFFKRTYVITGFDGASQAKTQLSFKYELWSPAESHTLYVGYSQLMLFNVYDVSTPLEEINFDPTLFYEYVAPRIGVDPWRCTTSRLRVELEHISNGKGFGSRSFNRLSGAAAFGCYGRSGHHVELVLRVWPPLIGTKENPDMVDFIGYSELTLGYRSPKTGHWVGQGDVEVLLRKGAAGPPNQGTLMLHAAWHPFFGGAFERAWRFVPYVYAQFFTGYAETLSTYNVDQTLFRIGLGLSDYWNPPKGPRTPPGGWRPPSQW